MPLLFNLFQQAIINAWTLEQHQPDAQKRAQKDFRAELFQNLVGDFSAEKEVFDVIQAHLDMME